MSVHHFGPSGTIAHFDYTLDANGKRTSMTTADLYAYVGNNPSSFTDLSGLTITEDIEIRATIEQVETPPRTLTTRRVGRCR